MIKGIPRISVYIVTYNQEDVIHRTIGSILTQIDYVYEICVSDDHSTDRTWNILQEYSKNYPGLFKLNRNETNLGIFENTEKVWTMPTGDIVHDLAGDDCVGVGWFKKVVDFIISNKIDYKNELFCIYGDYKCIYPNGDTIVRHNDAISKTNGEYALKMSIRGIISSRSTCYSINILRKFKNVSQGKSYVVEDAQDKQLQILAEKNYYISWIGNVYYSGIGVSTIKDPSFYEERLKINEYSISLYEKWGVLIDEKDKRYALKFLTAYHIFSHQHSLVAFLKMVYSYLMAKDNVLPKHKDSKLRNCLFAILRRLPHKNVLHFS